MMPNAERNILHTGRKLEMGRRLAFLFNKLEANSAAPPLATDYIRR
jgi:hypothetical protein